MGGEDTVRGFDIRAISPVTFIPVSTVQQFSYLDPTSLDAGGNARLKTLQLPVMTYQITFPGGDMQGVGNLEYRIPIVGPVTMALFVDAGTNGIIKRSGLQLAAAGLQDLQTSFPNANLKGQLPLASGTNFRLRSSAGVEFVVQLPIVQAPFRIFYAYNVARMRQQLVAPPGLFNQATLDMLKMSLPPGVYADQVLPQLNNFVNNPGRLNFFEPSHTFRFTVSRTF